MRILYLNPDPGVPVYGRKGCSTHVREVCRAMVRQGHEVLCLTANAGVDHAHGEGSDSFELHELPPLRAKILGSDFRRFLYNARLRRNLTQLCASFKPDFIYERYTLYGTAGQFMASRLGIPHILEVNTFLAAEQAHRLKFPKWAEKWERSIWRGAKALSIVSTPLAEEMQRRGLMKGKFRVFPMAVEPERFALERDSERCCDRFKIVYTGTLTGWHGTDAFLDLAEMWKGEAEKGNGIAPKLHLIGGDPFQVERFQAKVDAAGMQDYLEVEGNIPYDEIPERLRCANAGFIAPTSKFSSPTKLFEYMAAGLAVVGPDQPAVREVVTDGETGLLYAPDNMEGAKAALERLRNDPELAKRLGAAAREHVAKHHTWGAVAKGIADFYLEIIGENTTKKE